MATYRDIVIANLHQAKSGYQRNLLTGSGVVLVLAIFVALFVPEGDAPRDQLNSEVMFEIPARASIGGGDNGGGGRAAAVFSGHTIDGFGGFDGYRVARDDAAVMAYRATYRPIDQGRPYAPFGVPGSPDIRTVARGDMGSAPEIGDGLPGGPTLIQIAGALFPRQAHFRGRIEPPRPDEPAFIRLTKVPRVSSNYCGKGCVSVEFTIMRNGNIVDRAVVDEDPTGFGAADSLFAALGEALCWAARNHGRAVDTRITFTWQYCRGNDCGKDDVVTFGDQRVLVYDATPPTGPIAGR